MCNGGVPPKWLRGVFNTAPLTVIHGLYTSVGAADEIQDWKRADCRFKYPYSYLSVTN